MGYVDFHTHILPEIDDGSDSVEKSYMMLKKMADEDVDVVFATPHCLLSREDEKSFLQRRAVSFNKLKTYLANVQSDFKVPEIRLGAEIRVTQEMKMFEYAEALSLEGTNMIMYELPYDNYKMSYGENIYNLSLKAKKVPVLAHAERYIDIYSENDYGDLFSIPNIICQISTDFMQSKKSAKFAATLIDAGIPLAFGSDCHNMTTRPPQMKSLLIKKKKFCSKYKIMEYTMEELFYFHKQLI